MNLLGTPAAEVTADAALVSRLLAEQHPDLSHLPVRSVGAGWDNAIFRLGNHLCARLPRRNAAAALILHEQTWLPLLAERLSLPVPTPQRVGRPGCGYPWGWSVLPWLPGRTALEEEPPSSQAPVLAAFLRSLHHPAPPEAPANPVRGVPLSRRAAAVEERMQRLAEKTDLMTPAIRKTWQTALRAAPAAQARWLHGDLHARNVLVHQGAISAIIDWGDMTSGDPATDLASIWMLFAEQKARETALSEYGDLSEAASQRAKGWAIVFGVLLLDTGLIDHPEHAVLGERTLRRVAADSAV